MKKKQYFKEILFNKMKKFVNTYEQKVSFLIRQKYSINEELSILRQRDTKPDEFAEYNDYCELCKQLVKDGKFDE